MKFKSLGRLVAALVLGAGGVRAAEHRQPPVTPNVQDETGTMSANYEHVAELQANLDEFERQTHLKLFVQYHVKSPPDAEDKNPGDYMRALSAKLGLIKHGILMVHFGDDPDWRVWIGDDLTAKFAGKPGTAKELTDSGAMHEAKEAMLKEAMKHAAEAYAATHLPTPDPKNPDDPYATVLLRVQTVALIDALTAKFSPP